MVVLGGHAGLLWGGCVVAPGGCMVALGGMCMVALGGCAWLLPGGHAWDMTRYGDTVNEQPVRILLECILVFKCDSGRAKQCNSECSLRQKI